MIMKSTQMEDEKLKEAMIELAKLLREEQEMKEALKELGIDSD